MYNCKSCGWILSQDMLFCPNCGVGVNAGVNVGFNAQMENFPNSSQKPNQKSSALSVLSLVFGLIAVSTMLLAAFFWVTTSWTFGDTGSETLDVLVVPFLNLFASALVAFIVIFIISLGLPFSIAGLVTGIIAFLRNRTAASTAGMIMSAAHLLLIMGFWFWGWTLQVT